MFLSDLGKPQPEYQRSVLESRGLLPMEVRLIVLTAALANNVPRISRPMNCENLALPAGLPEPLLQLLNLLPGKITLAGVEVNVPFLVQEAPRCQDLRVPES